MKTYLWVIFFGLILLLSSGQPSETIQLKGGKFKTTDPQTGQVLQVKVGDLEVDKFLVTVADYEVFTQATGYKTQAERFGNSLLFNFESQKWEVQDGVDFRYPFGRDAPKAPPSHPVTQVSWYDAVAYAKWKGKRLPTDAEWEYIATRGGKLKSAYPWGNESIVQGSYKANYWQGSFPYYNSQADGFLTTSPVGFFGEDKTGLTDMGGNVWQWCADAVQPTGCNADDDPRARRICRGGSFMCDKNVCHGFKIGNRTNSTPESGMVHIGFRCVKDVKLDK